MFRDPTIESTIESIPDALRIGFADLWNFWALGLQSRVLPTFPTVEGEVSMTNSKTQFRTGKKKIDFSLSNLASVSISIHNKSYLSLFLQPSSYFFSFIFKKKMCMLSDCNLDY